MRIQNKKYKNLFFILIATAIFILIFEVIPRVYDLTGLAFNLMNNNEQIDLAVKKKEHLDEKMILNNILKKKIGGIVSDYEESQNISSIIKLLDVLSFESKLKIKKINPAKIIKKESLWLQPVSLEIEATYPRLHDFLIQLEMSPKVAIINNLSAENKNDSKLLSIKIEMDVYLNI